MAGAHSRKVSAKKAGFARTNRYGTLILDIQHPGQQGGKSAVEAGQSVVFWYFMAAGPPNSCELCNSTAGLRYRAGLGPPRY